MHHPPLHHTPIHHRLHLWEQAHEDTLLQWLIALALLAFCALLLWLAAGGGTSESLSERIYQYPMFH